MIQKRYSLFETNSSSTHAIVVHKTKSTDDLTDKFWFSDWGMETAFGRCESMLVDSVQNKIAYAYIVVKDIADWKKEADAVQKFLDNLYSVSEEFYNKNKYSEFSKQNIDNVIYFIDNQKEYNAYVDHVEDFCDNGFYRRLVDDKDFVRRLVYDENSYITVGGDEYRGYNLKKIGFEHDYDYGYSGKTREIGDDGYYKYVDPADYYIGEFWDKVKELRKENEIFFKGN